MRFTGEDTKKLIKEQGVNVVIPYGYTDIFDAAFFGCAEVKSITIPNSVMKIEMCAFWDCKKLRKVIIPDSVITIERSAFKNCEKVIVYCSPDSYAYKYCVENNIKVKKSNTANTNKGTKQELQLYPQLQIDTQNIFQVNKTQGNITDKTVKIDNELKNLIDKIDAYNKEIKNLIYSIKDMSIHSELIKTEETMRKIQMQLKDPANVTKKTKRIDQFLDYYMLAALKILNKYKNIEVYNLTDDNTVKIKKQVYEFLPTVKKALEKELNNMFDERNIDIATDVEMLESMMHMDGFIDKNK